MNFIFFYLLICLITAKYISTDYKLENTNYVDKSLLIGKFNPAKHNDFVKIHSDYTTKNNIYMQKKAYDAFKNMHEAAKKDEITLTIISATRTFKRQKQLWENKWNGTIKVNGKNLKTEIENPYERAKIILQYSAMPGISRHHWGTDIDINSLSLSYFNSPKGKKEYNWLTENAHKYGFCQPYKNKPTERPTGFENEPWHWSYKPLSCKLISEYYKHITYDDISGFLGSETARKLNVINDYVLGIHKTCVCE